MSAHTHEQVQALLESLKFKGAGKYLNDTCREAEEQDASYLQFLHILLLKEVAERNERRLRRNLTGAHFPVEKRIEDFDFSKVEGITERDVQGLRDFRWIDTHENLLFLGPPGLGKTHLSIAIGLEAVYAGYKVCFERMTNLVKLLKSAEVQRTSALRLNRIFKSHVLVIDEIGYTPIERKEANFFFNLVSEIYEKSSIVITSNTSFNEWAELLGDEVLTTALLDRLLHQAHTFSLRGESYRIQKRKEE